MDAVVRVTLEDGLAFPSGAVAPASYACVIYCRVPEDWTADGALKEERHEAVLEYLYGKTFRQGNEDGSRYVYRNFRSHVLTPEEEASTPWRDVSNDREFHYWHCHATGAEEGELRRVDADAF